MTSNLPHAFPDAGLPIEALGARLLEIAASVGAGRGRDEAPVTLHPHDIARFAAPLFATARAGQGEIAQTVEAELRAHVLAATGLGAGAVCTLTGSGSESLLLALQAARRARPLPGGHRPRVIAARNVHPAALKAARMLDVEVVLTDCAPGDVADPEAFARALDPRTILLIASAPAWGCGACDPVAKLAELARAAGVQCHVDACIGGLLFPFLDRWDGEARAAAFAHPGVSSLSVDLHKFGYSPPTLSALCFASATLAQSTRFSTTEWDGFAYASGGVAGDRPFWPIVAAWAVIQGLGRAGYEALAERLVTQRAGLIAAASRGGLDLARPASSAVVCLQSAGLSGPALSRRLDALGVANLFCRQPGYVRLRVDPLASDAAFGVIRDGLGRASHGTD